MKETLSRTITLALSMALAAAAFAPGDARAGEAAGTASFSTAFASRYVWRGQILSEGFVAQPTVGIALGGFSANLWSNVDLDATEEDDDGVAMNETDLTLSYTLPAGPVSLSGGLIHYDFDGADTRELYLTVAVSTLLNPALTVYYDVDEGDGAFAILALSQAIPAGPVSLTAAAAVGFNLGDKAMGLNAAGEDFTGPYYGEVSLATSIPIFGKVSLDPRIAYCTALGDDGEAAIEAVSIDGKKAAVYGSVAITVAF